MGWFWRKDADGGSDPNDSERPDGAQGPIDPWGYEPSASGGGVRTGNSEFEAHRFDMVRPISQERVGLLFDGEGWDWEIDQDGDLRGMWEGQLFCFRFLGDSQEVLSIIAFMSETIPAKYEADLLLFLEGWHREYLWPKAYFHREAKGGLRLVAEVNSDYEAKRFHDITLQPLEIVKAREGLFNDWLKLNGKLGGQHKVPRLSNSRKNMEELLQLNEQERI